MTAMIPYGPRAVSHGAPGDSAQSAVAQAQSASSAARVAQAWGAGSGANPMSLAGQHASLAYNNAFRARAMGAQIPESVWSAAGAGFQRRPVPVRPWLGTWSPVGPGSGIRGLPSMTSDLDAALGLEAGHDADILMELESFGQAPARDSAMATASRELRRARVQHRLERKGGSIIVHTADSQRGRAASALMRAFPGKRVMGMRLGHPRSFSSSRAVVVTGV